MPPVFVCNVGVFQALWEYFPMPLEGNFLYNLSYHWNWYLEHTAPSGRRHEYRNIIGQPTWRWRQPRTGPRGTFRQASPESGDARFACILEPLGTYCPAHFHRGQDYGMVLSQGHIVRMAADVLAFCPEEPWEVVLAACCHVVYGHLVAHAWIEDICALLDFQRGCDRSVRQRPYALARKRYGPLLAMEEAYCHGVALFLLSGLLEPVPDDVAKSRSIPPFNGTRIHAAMERWIAKNVGGSACRPIRIESLVHEDFGKQVCTLLESLYGCAATDMTVRQFFGIDRNVAPEDTERDYKPRLAQVDIYPIRAI